MDSDLDIHIDYELCTSLALSLYRDYDFYDETISSDIINIGTLDFKIVQNIFVDNYFEYYYERYRN